MIVVEYPEPQFRMKEEQGRRFLFDNIRRCWLQLTEEEWVRQNFVQYLISVMHYPASLVALEKEISLNGLKKRFDILIYDRAHQPWMMVECKSPKVQLSENVLQQVLRYNISVPVIYLVITNGNQTTGWKKEDGSLIILQSLPQMA
jgi:hypothetical protein